MISRAAATWSRKLINGERTMDKFEQRRMDDAEFRNCSFARALFENVNLGEARFSDVNLAGARLENVNLSGLTIENANVKGLKIFGYDVEAWLKEQLAKDGCHLD
jgi:uncharacterized protein YjbI with pentapeptide repeats